MTIKPGSLELHIIQNFPPSNLNRDDLGQPKSCTFGGFRRARVSSQCLKRSIRTTGKNRIDSESPSVFERYTGVPLSQRSQLIARELERRLEEDGAEEQGTARTIAVEFARIYSSKKGSMNRDNPEQTSVLLYLADPELDHVAKQLKEQGLRLTAERIRELDSQKHKKPETRVNKSPIIGLVKEWIKKTSKRTGGPDIALFGRMLADRPDTNVDASCQVAHAISTHIVNRNEIDFFTVVDDLKPQDETGAAFLDVAYFNSACFYRYARLDLEQLQFNLKLADDDDAKALIKRTVEGFLRASEAAIPSGKKNAYGQECRPSFMMAVVRSENSPGWSLVNAFEKPVYVGETFEEGQLSLVEQSVQRLERKFNHLRNFYDDDSVLSTLIALPDGDFEIDVLGEEFQQATQPKMSGWVDAICAAIH